VRPLPAAATGEVTFGCFNNPAKYSPQLFDAWAAILQRASRSHLLLKFRGLHIQEVQDRIRAELVRRGITAERVLIEGQVPHEQLFAAYHRVDLALDTQPYSGGVTTCEALWMGVPVITWPGRTFAGRHCTSYLATAGLQQFIASGVAGYIELAVQWAARLDELAAVRLSLRDRLSNSSLCDAPRFAHDLLAVLAQAHAQQTAAAQP